MKAREYLELFKPRCSFMVGEQDYCQKPAEAVYVTADDRRQAKFVCDEHGREAELNADGPVFWPFDREESITSMLKRLEAERDVSA